jgi:hypothetical protein
MVYRFPHAAPQSRLPEGRRGRVVGRFCLTCGSIFPLHRARHSGKPVYGRDHVASPCAHEGEAFAPGASWWDQAVEVLPEAVAAQQAEPTRVANAPAAGTEPSAGPSGPASAPGKGTEPTAPGVVKP